MQYLLRTPFKPSSWKSLSSNVLVSYHLSKHSLHSSKSSSENSSKHLLQNSSKHSLKRSSKHWSRNSNNSRELNVTKSKTENYPVVNDLSNFDIWPNSHSVVVPSNGIKNHTWLPREILAYSTLKEPFDPANYSNNTPTKSSLSSSASYLSILERRKALEHAELEAKLAEDQAKRKLELYEKSFQKQKIEKRSFNCKGEGCISELWTKSVKHFLK